MEASKSVQSVNPENKEVFLCLCPVYLPFSFAVHPWFVVNDYGEVNRWEVIEVPRLPSGLRGNLHKNLHKPFEGIEMFIFKSGLRWNSRIYKHYSGSAAEELIETIENSPDAYPHTEVYKLLGPNSNTYAQWVLDQTSIETDLPWNAIGKRYHRKYDE